MKYMTIIDFCHELNMQALTLTEFVLQNTEETKIFLGKLYIIKEAINYHLMQCKICKFEEETNVLEEERSQTGS